MSNSINRFIEAQERDFEIALLEIQSGKKRSHWMWYIFPQIKGLGISAAAEYYGINGIWEGKAYLNDNYLKNNLLKICNALLQIESNNANEVMGYPDNLKLKSSMTLFNYIDPSEKVFKEVLNKFYNGEIDNRTLEIINIFK